MKPIPEFLNTLRASPTLRLAWALRLTAEPGVEFRRASIPLTLDDAPYPPGLTTPPEWSMKPAAARSTLGVGGRVFTRAILNLADTTISSSSSALRDWLGARSPIGLYARLELIFLGPDDELQNDGRLVALDGRVLRAEISPVSVRLHLVDHLTALADKRIGRELTPAMIGGRYSPSLGRPLPIVFGRRAALELTPLAVGAATKLRAPFTIGDSAIPVASLENFPASGRVQVAEVIYQYLAIDPVALTLGTPAQPATPAPGETPRAHSKGEPVREVPDAGFEWLVADHPCGAVRSVSADGAPLDPSDWTTTQRALGGLAAQVVTMARWPAGLASEAARVITADMDGWSDAGDPLENPADILQLLLTNPRFADLDPALIDAASLDEVRAELDAAGFTYSRALTAPATLGDLIDSAAREAAVWVRAGGAAITFARRSITPSPAQAVETLDDSNSLDPRVPISIESARDGLVKDALRLIGPPTDAGQPRRVWTRAPGGSTNDPAAQPESIHLQWLAASDAALANLGERLWADLREPALSIEQRHPIGQIPLEPGDTVNLNRARPELIDTPHWIESIATDGAGRLRVITRGAEAGAQVWTNESGDALRPMAFGARMPLLLAGRPVLELEREGWLKLIRALREDAAFTPPEVQSPIQRVGDHVYWSTGEGETFTPFARIDNNGLLELNGTLRESQPLTFDPAGENLIATADRFQLSTDGRTPALEYRAEDQTLLLPGELIELAEL